MVGGIAFQWVFAVNYESMEDYGIMEAPTDTRPDGSVFITAENPWKVVC